MIKKNEYEKKLLKMNTWSIKYECESKMRWIYLQDNTRPESKHNDHPFLEIFLFIFLFCQDFLIIIKW